MMGTKWSPCMEFVYWSRQWHVSQDGGKSSVRAWTLCFGVGQWFLAHTGEKVVSAHEFFVLREWYVAHVWTKVVSVYGLCLPV